VPEFHYYSLDN